MNNTHKIKKQRPLELCPLNLTNTQYKPYFSGLPHRKLQENAYPLDSIIFDIPPIESAKQMVELTETQRLRAKILKYFEQKTIKQKQQWELYQKKSEIFSSKAHQWVQLEIYLLKILVQLINQTKKLAQQIKQHQKQRQSSFENSDLHKSSGLQYKNFAYEEKNCRTHNYSQNELSRVESTMKSYKKQNVLDSINKSKILNNSGKLGSRIQHDQISGINEQKSYIPKENHEKYKISKLQKQLELYKENIKTIKEQYLKKIKELQAKIQIQTESNHFEAMKQKMKYQSEVETKKFYNIVLTQQYKTLKQSYQQLQKQANMIKRKYEAISEDKQRLTTLYQFKELWQMEHEQILHLQKDIQSLKTEKQAEQSKNKALKQKLKELSKNFNYNYNISTENEKDRQDLNSVLKQFRDWLKFFAVPRVNKGMMNNNTFFPEFRLESKQNFSQLLPKDDTTDYKLLRPNFFIYFQAYQSIILAEKKFPQKKIMPPSHFLIMRAIFDAMYLHLNFTADYKSWINFPQFVISFFQKFQIGVDSRKPVIRRVNSQSQQKINFLLNVFNIQAANTWECQIFRSFLLEQFTLDEIYFYLDCRDDLIKGSHLNNNFGSSDPLTFVQLNIAEQIIRQKLKNYDREMIERIKKLLGTKKKHKNNKQFVDVNFVLKLLLQIYSIQKIKSERFFHHNFKGKNSASNISYTEYSAFMCKNFDFLSKADIAKLYRQIYALGLSQVTYKTIHHICSIKGLFIPLLRKKMAGKSDILNEGKPTQIFQDILFLDLQNTANNMVQSIQQLGLEEVTNINLSLNRFLRSCESSAIERSQFEQQFLRQTQKIAKVKSILSWKNQKNIEYQVITKEQIREKLAHLLTFIHQSDEDMSQMKKKKDGRQKAINKLIKNFKIRIQQSLAQFRILEKRQQIQQAQAQVTENNSKMKSNSEIQENSQAQE